MLHQIITLASYLILEAFRTRFFTALLVLILIGFGFSLFVGQVAIVEKQAIQGGLLAAFLRLMVIYAVSLFVIISTVREFHDHAIYLWLSLPLPRSVYFLGRLSGFILIACLSVFLISLTLLTYVPWLNLLFWSISLSCELLIMTAVSLLFALTLHQTVQAFSAVVGFYILARSINGLQLMVQSPLQMTNNFFDQLINQFVYFLAMLLPNLDRFTRSEWLLYPLPDSGILIEILIQTGIYLLLLISMSLFDLYRKNL